MDLETLQTDIARWRAHDGTCDGSAIGVPRGYLLDLHTRIDELEEDRRVAMERADSLGQELGAAHSTIALLTREPPVASDALLRRTIEEIRALAETGLSNAVHKPMLVAILDRVGRVGRALPKNEPGDAG